MPGRRWVAAGLTVRSRYAAGASPGEPWLARSRFGDLITRPGRAPPCSSWAAPMGGAYRADSGEDGHRMAVLALGGFLNRIAEAITRAGAAAG